MTISTIWRRQMLASSAAMTPGATAALGATPEVTGRSRIQSHRTAPPGDASGVGGARAARRTSPAAVARGR
jgi:hypothetical protein